MARLPFRRGRRDDEIVIGLTTSERDMLARLPEELGAVMGGEGPDGIRERLFPRAYLDPTEEAAEDEWQTIVHPELVRQKTDALATLASTLARAAEADDRVEITLSAPEVEAWLSALNDARLALGVGLGVTEDLDWESIDASDPANAPYAIYHWLSELQEGLVETLLG